MEKRHVALARDAMKTSLQYFKDIGAKVAPKKCFITSTCSSARARLRTYRWCAEGQAIPTKNHFRDLGAHMCLDNSKANTTLTERCDNAADATTRLDRLPLTTDRKAEIIRTNVLPAALYGSEVGEASKRSMNRLTTAIVNAIGPKGKKRSTVLTFEICSGKGRDLDPVVH